MLQATTKNYLISAPQLRQLPRQALTATLLRFALGWRSDAFTSCCHVQRRNAKCKIPGSHPQRFSSHHRGSP